MGIYQLLINGYMTVLSIFPAPLRWLVTLLILVGLVMTFITLIRASWLWLILLVLLLPVIVPILAGFFAQLWAFFLFLLTQTGLRT
jgi:hypothetical protein